MNKANVTRINWTARTKQTYMEHARLRGSGSTSGSISSRSLSRTKSMLFIIAATTLRDLWQTACATKLGYIVFNYPKEIYALKIF